MEKRKPLTSPGLGEMAQNLPMDYRGFSVHGGLHRFLHTPADGSDSTAPELLEPVALALSRALESIEALAKQ